MVPRADKDVNRHGGLTQAESLQATCTFLASTLAAAVPIELAIESLVD